MTLLALVDLGTKVTTFFQHMKTAPDAQQGLEGKAGGESDQVTPAFDAMATQLYANLGGLMSLYRAHPPTVAMFFDLDTLRRPATTSVRGRHLSRYLSESRRDARLRSR